MWLRLHFVTPLTMYYKLTASPSLKGSYLPVSQGIVGPDSQPPVGGPYVFNGVPIQAVCQTAAQHPASIAPCMAAHGYRGYLTYQPASRFWAFQWYETAIFLALALVLTWFCFWRVSRRRLT